MNYTYAFNLPHPFKLCSILHHYPITLDNRDVIDGDKSSSIPLYHTHLANSYVIKSTSHPNALRYRLFLRIGESIRRRMDVLSLRKQAGRQGMTNGRSVRHRCVCVCLLHHYASMLRSPLIKMKKTSEYTYIYYTAHHFPPLEMINSRGLISRSTVFYHFSPPKKALVFQRPTA